MFSRLYEYMRSNMVMTWTSLTIITLGLVFLMLKQTYKEDISDFLPLDNKYQKAMKVYQQLSGAERIAVLFKDDDTDNPDPDKVVQSIEFFLENLQENDSSGIADNVVAQIDLEQFSQLSDFIYENIPYFLSEEDYCRIDSLLSDESFIHEQLAKDKQMLMFPVAGMFANNIQKDPLNLFTPVLQRLRKLQTSANYETYDGYIFSEDLNVAMISVNSHFGASETENNKRLVDLLSTVAQNTMDNNEDVEIRLLGGPVIAVGNAQQIKSDSILSITIAVVLILILLFVAFRNIRSIFLIVISVAWGWLFAMGGLALVHDHVSTIVIGISSVIIGIAVNYPLHLIAHLNHTQDVKTALKEIVTPLIVGNVTTVGAFLALVPLKSVALRDLGLFSSFLLIGTIIFVIIFLPHLVKANKKPHKIKWLNAVSEFSIEKKRWVVWIVTALTVLFTFFCFKTSFDPNLRNINFMTDQQMNDMAYFQQLFSVDSTKQNIYVVSSDANPEMAIENSNDIRRKIEGMNNDSAVVDINSCTEMIALGKRQSNRLQRWSSLVEKYGQYVENKVKEVGLKEDFASDSFDDFFKIIYNSYSQKMLSDFNPLLQSVFVANVFKDKETDDVNVVDVITLDKQRLNQATAYIEGNAGKQIVFDVDSMNSTIASTLSDDFNYIGWACGLIVFFFLWMSFGNFELAVISFLPMAISWVWILGIMALIGIQFNLVNIILATFIFGQGDDYTIFMTEGCQYEYAYRRKMLASYKESIIISALIMFIGIGSLIFARHPALHSLAEVTIVGMFSVVLMAYLFPPLIFKWLVAHGGICRQQPISLSYVWNKKKSPKNIDQHISDNDDNLSLFEKINDYRDFVIGRYRYKGVGITNKVKHNLNQFCKLCRQKKITDFSLSANILVVNSGWGEIPLLIALAFLDKTIYTYEIDDDKKTVAKYAAEDVASNINVITDLSEIIDIQQNDMTQLKTTDMALLLINPSDDDKLCYAGLNPQILFL